MVKIIFEAHSTTTDNEKHISTGHYDVELSELGLRQSKELGNRYENMTLNTVYCSDLQRAYKTAEIAFEGRDDIKIVKDRRLRECDYGDYTQASSDKVSSEKEKRICEPFPNGESYEDCAKRMKSFLDEIVAKHHKDDVIMVIGHRATQYGLNHWIFGHSLHKCVTDKWSWQPGWEYEV